MALSFLTPGMPLIYTSNEEGYDHMIEFFEKDTVKWDDKPKYAPLMAALSKVKTENAALNATNRDFKVLTKDEDYLFSFSRSPASFLKAQTTVRRLVYIVIMLAAVFLPTEP